jgi:F1F0 ATPase subunit 2
MTETLRLMLALLIGVWLGAIFFGGLWWTVQRAFSSTQPALWFLGSLVVRTSVVMAGFYFVARDNWQHVPVCLVGFVAARLMVTHITRVEASHAP